MFLKDIISFFFSADKALSDSIKNVFGFAPDNIHLYQLAFKHKSASNETINGYKLSNERLEFLGDAILSAVIADYLFRIFPYKNEGFLTEMRSRIVSRASLNKLAQKLGLDKFITLSGENKGMFRSVNGDAFEAFIGAVYLDKGFIFTKKIIETRVIALHVDIENLQNSDFNFKSKLLEWGQKEKRSVEFIVADELGEGFKKQYLVEVLIDGQSLASAQDFAIKGAEQLAAERAWIVIQGVIPVDKSIIED